MQQINTYVNSNVYHKTHKVVSSVVYLRLFFKVLDGLTSVLLCCWITALYVDSSSSRQNVSWSLLTKIPFLVGIT